MMQALAAAPATVAAASPTRSTTAAAPARRNRLRDQRGRQARLRRGGVEHALAGPIHARPAPLGTIQAQYKAARGGLYAPAVVDAATMESLEPQRRRAALETGHQGERPRGRRPIWRRLSHSGGGSAATRRAGQCS